MKKLLPLLMLLLGSGAGVGAGIFLKPTEVEVAEAAQATDVVELEDTAQNETTQEDEAHGSDDHGNGNRANDEHGDKGTNAYEYVKLTNQFVVPIVHDERIASMVVAGLSIEIASGYEDQIMAKEPKLRSAFLRVMFDHANMGGFDGAFTELRNLDVLQNALLEVAQKTIGADLISDVLIFEIARQDY